MKKCENSIVNHVFCKHGFYNYLMNLCTLFVSLFAVRDGSRTAATSKMELFLIIVNGVSSEIGDEIGDEILTPSHLIYDRIDISKRNDSQISETSSQRLIRDVSSEAVIPCLQTKLFFTYESLYILSN